MQYSDSMVFNMPNCGVTAISLATGIDYIDVHNHVRSTKRKPKLWKGRMLEDEISDALYHFNVDFVRTNLFNDRRVTEFAHYNEDKNQTYIVFVSGHYQTIKKGLIGDNISIYHWSLYNSLRRNYKIKDCWVLT